MNTPATRLSEKQRTAHSLYGAKWGRPEFKRLSFNESSKYLISELNTEAVEEFLSMQIDLADSAWSNNPDLFGSSGPQKTIATVDRYGLPLRTVLSEESGLMRTDPYYSDDLLQQFYSRLYRKIYSVPYSTSAVRVLRDQVVKGTALHGFLSSRSINPRTILDYGCGMGGMLIPFVQSGSSCVGCDLGEEFLSQGRRLGLKLICGGVEDVKHLGQFSLVILSHVLEHIRTPREFLKAIREIIEDGGHLVVEVPGIRSIPTSYQGDILRYLQNAHVWHFNRSTLARLLKEAGFCIEFIDDSVFALVRKAEGARSEPSLQEDTWSFLKQTERKFTLKRIYRGLGGAKLHAVKRRITG